MIWYIQNADRFRLERLGLDRLVGEADWLQPFDWRIDASARINWDADILVGEQTFPVTLRYPNHFPHSPPLVLPRGEITTRWSSHQWGAGGELCLEVGPDNWQPHITGAQMLESAQRLLVMEADVETAQEIPSRHKSTLGQDLRLTFSRLLCTPTLSALASSHGRPVLHGKANLAIHDESFVYHVAHFNIDGEDVWFDPSAPKPLTAENYNVDCILVRQPHDEELPDTTSPEDFRGYLAARGIVTAAECPLVLLHRPNEMLAYKLYASSVSTLTVVVSQSSGNRLTSDYGSLAGRKVAVVGCGSIGSKVACSLARSGVGKFLLVDDDLFLPENLVRHELDWRDIATHKADGIGRRIQLINPTAEVGIRRHRLGGHEASGNLETLIESISQMDLIIDATSTPEAFNYLCAAADTGATPMIWAEVHGGGIGGMIARRRPGIEPSPVMMRLAIENWCADKGIVTNRAERPYEDRNADVPWIADDADVSVIAGHATRMAIDLLIPRAPSIFPYSIYFIGLSEGWFYSEPFHTEPVLLEPLPSAAPTARLNEAEVAVERDLVLEILKRSFSEANPS